MSLTTEEKKRIAHSLQGGFKEIREKREAEEKKHAKRAEEFRKQRKRRERWLWLSEPWNLFKNLLPLYLIVAFFIGGFSVSVWVFRSYHEAKVFEERTGQPTTTWEAMWLEFRIVEAE